MAYFNTSRRMPQDLDSLFFIYQQEGESLKDYVAYFKVATLEVYHLDESMAMLALKKGLRTSSPTH